MTKIARIICTSMLIAMAVSQMAMAQTSSNDTLFQASAFSALMKGDFDGTMTFKDLSAHGDFGLGTVDNLDGEMMGLDGQFYQLKSDGKAYLINSSMETPFADVVFFKSDEIVSMNGTSNLTQIESYLDSKLPTKNLFYAIRIDGTFDYVKTRSPPAQSKPYPTLPEALKGQKIFEFHNISGTLVGLRCPDFADGISVPGYHMHFISSDRSSGGHILDLRLNNAKIKVDILSDLEMVLPNNNEFYQADLSEKDDQAVVQKIESNPKN